jgi:hypothetical protein
LGSIEDAILCYARVWTEEKNENERWSNKAEMPVLRAIKSC